MKKVVRLSARLAWFALVLAGSFLPYRDKRFLHTEGRLHLPIHVVMFFVAALLLGTRMRTGSRLLLSMCIVMALGVVIEVGEHLVFRSPLEWKDILIDTLAAACGSLAIHLWRREVIPARADEEVSTEKL